LPAYHNTSDDDSETAVGLTVINDPNMLLERPVRLDAIDEVFRMNGGLGM
jgi:hypothetical protein